MTSGHFKKTISSENVQI